MKHGTLNVVATLLLCYFATLSVGAVSAQQITLSLSPPILETMIKPGKSILVGFDLKNIGDPTVIKTKIVNFEPKDNYGNVLLKTELEGPVRFSLDNSMIQLNEPFFIKSGENQQLLLRIRVPEGAPNGDYYYTLLAETQPRAELGNGSGGTAKVTIGANILITVTDSGLLDTKGRISFFDVPAKNKLTLFGKTIRFFDSNDKIPITLMVNNYGRNIIKPRGVITLSGNFGERADYGLLPENVLAGSQRLIISSSEAELHRPLASLTLSGFFVGKYNLTANLGFTEEGPMTTSAYLSFFALPFKILFGVLGAIIITLIIIKKNKSDNTE